MIFDEFFEAKSDHEDVEDSKPVYDDVKIPNSLDVTRRQVFNWLGLDVTYKYDNAGSVIRDKKGVPIPYIIEAKEKTDDYDPQKYYNYAEELRQFLVKKYDEENKPIGGNTAEYPKIISNLINFDKLDPFDKSVYYVDDEGKKILQGYNNSGNSVNHWFPEMVSVRISKGKTEHYSIFDQIRDKKLFDKKFYRLIVDNKLKSFSPFPNDEKVFRGFKSGIRVVTGAQPVTNIRCPVAKWVWTWSMEKLGDKLDEFICWDPSMGWAGRLIGFLSASKHPNVGKKQCMYIGTDPNQQIFERYSMISKFWKTKINEFCRAEVRPLCIGSEDFCNTDEFKEFKGRGAVAYTSPPYFSKERYSDDPEQSYIKFSQYDLWRDGFLKPTIQNAYDFLAPGGHFYWNIADIYVQSKRLPLEQDSIDFAKEIGFEYVELLYQLMRTFPGRDQTLEDIKKQIKERNAHFIFANGMWQKFEPIYVFHKKED